MKKICFLTTFMTATTIQVFGQHGHHPVNSYSVSPLLIFLIVVVIILVGIIIYMSISNTRKRDDNGNMPPSYYLKERLAKGEINKETFIEIREKIEDYDENQHIQTAKLRFAKGEISIAEYEEMIDLLEEKPE
ncbi:MAG: SHOCT domain-containing protein [Bacteroidales bacterium]|nr:SHOCT domain-containing protein [Bacteroidales bacterium]